MFIDNIIDNIEMMSFIHVSENCRCPPNRRETGPYCNSCLQQMSFEEYMQLKQNVEEVEVDQEEESTVKMAFQRPKVDAEAIRKDVKFLKPFAKPFDDLNYDLMS